jgi:AcrR family transcriptional regulator
MTAFERKRADLTDRLVDLAVTESFERFGLRDQAAALGTSDHMLLYYFKTKSDLVRAVLRRVPERLAEALAGADQPAPPEDFLVQALAELRDPAIAPLVRIWTEAVARGARGEEPYRQAANAAIGQWKAWIVSRLLMPEGPAKTGLATTLLAFFEGAVLLEQARPGSTEDAEDFLQMLLSRGLSQDA